MNNMPCVTRVILQDRGQRHHPEAALASLPHAPQEREKETDREREGERERFTVSLILYINAYSKTAVRLILEQTMSLCSDSGIKNL